MLAARADFAMVRRDNGLVCTLTLGLAFRWRTRRIGFFLLLSMWRRNSSFGYVVVLAGPMVAMDYFRW